ncbi:TorD/DmsD family molecular chaperone [Thiogranum longum]|jgi:TorA maturation chaperone TorD
MQNVPEQSRSAAPHAVTVDPEQEIRAGAYRLLASLFRAPPGAELLDTIARLPGDGADAGELGTAIALLRLAASTTAPAGIDDEFHELFIGLGRGELVPFGSWYLTGFLMEKPLSSLRMDLARFGFEREDGVFEPEDHVSALCEVMSLMILEGRSMHDQQTFFSNHLATWLERFFADLRAARSAVFYRAVGRFAAAFTAFEAAYLGMGPAAPKQP